MGLFSGFGSKDLMDKEFNTFEAASGVLLSVVASDGEISDEEVDTFSLLANRHPIFVQQSPHEFRRMIDEQFSILRKRGWEALADKASSHLPSNLRPTVFALAVDLVLADGRVEVAEEKMIDSLRRKLGVEEEDARRIVEVLALKNGA
ncbi:MAG: tellurite resistance TerB family protein [Pseudomonadota bacterium]